MLRKIIDSMCKGIILQVSSIIYIIIISIGYYRVYTIDKIDCLFISSILVLIYVIVIRILKSFDSYYKEINKIKKMELTYDKINNYFEKVLPEKRKTFPKKIYKYVQLKSLSADFSNELNNYYYSENEKRFNTLKEKTVWLSNIPSLNDPYEGYRYEYSDMFLCGLGVLDSKTSKEYCNQRSKSFQKMCEHSKKSIYTSCFSKTYNNMPMWAHYSSNFEGYCIEYEIVDPSKLYDVMYINGVLEVGMSLEKLLDELIFDSINIQQFYDVVDKLVLYIHSAKSKQWEYEEEIRIIEKNIQETKNGYNKKIEDLGLKVTKVLIGLKCSKENEERLRCICNDLEIEVEKMKFEL